MKVAMVPTPVQPQATRATTKNKRAPGVLTPWGDVVGELLEEVCQRHHTEVLVAPGAHGNSPVCLLLVAHDQDVRDLLHRMLADFIGDFLVAQIKLRL
jgi:hypothetical protein